MDQAATLALRQIGDVLIVAHNEMSPAPEEWARFIKAAREDERVRVVLVMVHPDCPGLNAAQRSEVSAIYKAKKIRCAVMTSSKAQRLIMTALQWLMGEQIGGFRLGDWSGAMEFISVAPEDRARVIAEAQAAAGAAKIHLPQSA